MTKKDKAIRSLMILASFGMALLVAMPAVAASKAQPKERQAKKACLSGDYAKGVGILADLFVETNDPTFLYNQGRCYEQNVRYVEAAERFREYLRKATNLSADDRADVDKHIADCEAAAAKSQTRATEPAPIQTPIVPVPTPSAYGPPVPSVPEPVPPPAVASTPPTSTEVTYGWPHSVKWVATGVAVAGLGFGVAEHLRYYGKNRDYNNNVGCPSAAGCKSLADSADLAQKLAIVGYATAGVATVAAITLWLVDTPVKKPSAPVSFSCVPAPAGAACAGRF